MDLSSVKVFFKKVIELSMLIMRESVKLTLECCVSSFDQFDCMIPRS